MLQVVGWQSYYMGCKVAFIYLTYLGLYAVPPAVTLEHRTTICSCVEMVVVAFSFLLFRQ